MLIFLGYFIVLGSVFGGFALGGGHLLSLFQPFEFLMICGASFGAFIVGNNYTIIRNTFVTTYTTAKNFGYNKKYYTELLALMFELTDKIKKKGPLAVEDDIDNVNESPVFSKYKLLKRDTEIVDFLVDHMRIIITGRVTEYQLETLMDDDIESFISEKEQAINAVNKAADGLPAFGIVAAVMGIVHTMEAMGGPPDELGALIAKALVGTFVGVLVGYGVVAPIAMLLENKMTSSVKALTAIKVILLATVKNLSPTLAAEFGRKTLHSNQRPNSGELEVLLQAIKDEQRATVQ